MQHLQPELGSASLPNVLYNVDTEFGAQGLELDGVLLAWGTDFIREGGRWSNRLAKRYREPRRIRDAFQLRRNAYRVLLPLASIPSSGWTMSGKYAAAVTHGGRKSGTLRGWRRVERTSSLGHTFAVYERLMPRIPDGILASVIFLFPTKEDAEQGKPVGGSGFLLAVDAEYNGAPPTVYAVTNSHGHPGGQLVCRPSDHPRRSNGNHRSPRVVLV